MGTLKELINRIASGETDVKAAIPDFQRVLRTSDPDRPAGQLTFEQKEERAQAGLSDSTDTFTEVTSAWIQGKLTDEQYTALRNAATEGLRVKDPEAVFGRDDFSDIDPPEGWVDSEDLRP